MVKGKNKGSPEAKDALVVCADAAPVQDDPSAADFGGIDMIYYFSIDLSRTGDQIGDEGSGGFSGIVSEALSKRDCGIASVVYLAINDVIVFDRYREGVVLSGDAFQTTVLGIDPRRPRSSSIVSAEGDGEEETGIELENGFGVPGQVLEYILAFLPDAAVSAMSRVCREWSSEIGRTSPALWKHLLTRRDWPLPGEVTDEEENARDAFRDKFLAHYTAVRNVEAAKMGILAMVASSKKSAEEEEMVYQVFSTRRSAPQSPNGCVSVQVWSPSRVLAAYSHDCTLRLFKAVDKSSDSGSARACRELVCVSVDPYRNTKRRSCRLVAMGLDEELIGCLCHEIDDREEQETYLLIVMSRDDFLCSSDGSTSQDQGGASIEEGALQVINIAEAVLNYLISCDEVDHRLLRLFDFLSDGGEVSDVEVLVSQSMLALGHGRLLVEIAISIPYLHFDDPDDVDATMILLDRKLVIFSAAAGAIVWVGDSGSPDSLLPRHEDVTMASLRHAPPGGSRTACSVVLVSASSPMMICAEMHPTGHMESPRCIEASELVRNELLQEGWQLQQLHQRPVAITSSDIVAVDVLFRDLEERPRAHRSVLSFYPRHLSGIQYAILTLIGNCESIRMATIGEEHIVLVCRVHEMGPSHSDDQEEPDVPHRRLVYAILVHVPTRREIERICILEDASVIHQSATYDVPIFFVSLGDTVGVGISWKGVVLTGKDVREVGAGVSNVNSDTKSAKKQKKKKGQRTVRVNKKDVFARGLSLRG